jgi:hypothetical protein
MAWYHIYATPRDRSEILTLRAVARNQPEALAVANALLRGRPVPESPEISSRRGIAGVVTGKPVWTRNFRDQRPVILVTEHVSERSAKAAEADVIADASEAMRRAAVHEREACGNSNGAV